MSAKLTTREVLERFKSIHGDRYDYSKVEYVSTRAKVCITCSKHGDFLQRTSNHLRGLGCPKCAKDFIAQSNIKGQAHFLNKCYKTHGDKYDYSKSIYTRASEKVCIICPEHGEFWQTPANHYKGAECPKCAETNRRVTRRKTRFLRKNWNFEQPEDYKLIPLTKGKFAKVDNEDFDKVKGVCWCLQGRGENYAQNSLLGLMHRFIMNAPDHLDVDHINGDGLDNRRSNLRLATKLENSRNRRARKNTTSSFKGVSWDKHQNKWLASIGVHGKTVRLGYFRDEVKCAIMYDKEAIKLFGEFAHLNFPELKEEYLKQLEDGNK